MSSCKNIEESLSKEMNIRGYAKAYNDIYTGDSGDSDEYTKIQKLTHTIQELKKKALTINRQRMRAMRGEQVRCDAQNRKNDKLLKKAFQRGRDEGIYKQLLRQRIDYNTLSTRLQANQDEINDHLEYVKRSNRANRKRERDERISFIFNAKKLLALQYSEKKSDEKMTIHL